MSIKTKPKNRKGYWKTRCDIVFSKVIKLRSNYICEETGEIGNVQCAHIVSRRYMSTRWDLTNAICLSAKRHLYYTYRPVEWKEYINKRFGKQRLEMLERQALVIRKWSIIELRDLHKRLVKLEAEYENK